VGADTLPGRTRAPVEDSDVPPLDDGDNGLKEAKEIVGAFLESVKASGLLMAAGPFDRSVVAAAAIVAKHDEPFFDAIVAKLRKYADDSYEVDGWVNAVQRHVRGRSIRLTPASELMTRPDPQYLIDGVLEVESLSMLYATSGAGKTFVALSWCVAIAAGLPWLDHEVVQGPVIYIAAEGVGGIAKRLGALMVEFGLDEPPEDLYVIEQAVNLLDSYSMKETIAAAEEIGVDPRLIVFDTYARSMAGGDENAAKDVGLVVAALDDLGIRLRTAVMVVHHTTKNGASDRGSGALTGAVNTKILLDGAGVAALTLTIEKQKNFEAGDPISISLEPVGESLVPRMRTSVAPSFTSSVAAMDKVTAMKRGFLDALVDAHRTGMAPMTQSRLLSKVSGNADQKGRVLHQMVDDPMMALTMLKQGNKNLYDLDPGHDACPSLDTPSDSDSIPPPP